MTLPELSAAATQGEWREAYLDHNDQAVIQGDHTEIATFWHHCVGSLEKEMQANAQFVCALVNAYRTGQLVEREGVDLVGANTLPTEYVRWLSSIEVDVRVHDLTADEVARLVAALKGGEDA